MNPTKIDKKIFHYILNEKKHKNPKKATIGFYDAIIESIEKGIIENGQTINISEFSNELGISRSIMGKIAQQLYTNKFLSKKGNTYHVCYTGDNTSVIQKKVKNIEDLFGIKDWAESHNLNISTIVIECRKGTSYDLKHPQAWDALGKIHDYELYQIRRIRLLSEKIQYDQNIPEQVNTNTKLYPAIIEVAYIDPVILPGFFEYYKNGKHNDVSFSTYYKEQGLHIIKGQYNLKIRKMENPHLKHWKRFDDRYYDNKHFFRFKTIVRCANGPFEYSYSLIDPDIINFEIDNFCFIKNPSFCFK